MTCPKCGSNLKVGEKFCASCGEKTQYADMPFGKITFKRDNNFFGCAIPFKVFIDGELKGSLNTGISLSYDVPCCEHEISLNSINDKSKQIINLTEDKKELTVNVGVKMFALSFVAKGKIKSVE